MHVTPQIDCVGKMSTVLSVSTHIYGVSQEIDQKTFSFRVNQECDPSNLLSWKTSTGLRVSTHIYGVSQEIEQKTFIFRVSLGM